MRIDEVTGGLQTYTARIRVAVDGAGSSVCAIGIRAGDVTAARRLLAHCYGKANVLSVTRVVIEEKSRNGVSSGLIPTIKPKKNVIPKIKPLTPKQGMKRAAVALKKSIKHKERKTKAQLQVRKSQNKLADINRKPPAI
jgi:hypothetical protein